jgi:tetratricopeptide (TPR) repeat protein
MAPLALALLWSVAALCAADAAPLNALMRGYELHVAGRVAEALPLYLQAVQHDPGSSDAHHLLAVALHGSGRTAEALSYARRAVELAPANPNMWNTVGEIHRMLKCVACRAAPCPTLVVVSRARVYFPRSQVSFGGRRCVQCAGSLTTPSRPCWSA